MKYWQHTVATFASLLASIALAEDFQTIQGKEYKDVTVSRVEPDGIVLTTKTGISKVYFVELPKEVQERFLPTPPKTIAQDALIKIKSESAALKNPTSLMLFLIGAGGLIAAVAFALVRGRLQRQTTVKKRFK